jgi:gentisate 1,2-dioxygenase
MVTNASEIETPPEVQVVMNMDGWGNYGGKKAIYQEYIHDEPVEFTGVKLFYHNDTVNGSTMMTTDQVLKLLPTPVYIQYQ